MAWREISVPGATWGKVLSRKWGENGKDADFVAPGIIVIGQDR